MCCTQCLHQLTLHIGTGSTGKHAMVHKQAIALQDPNLLNYNVW